MRLVSKCVPMMIHGAPSVAGGKSVYTFSNWIGPAGVSSVNASRLTVRPTDSSSAWIKARKAAFSGEPEGRGPKRTIVSKSAQARS